MQHKLSQARICASSRPLGAVNPLPCFAPTQTQSPWPRLSKTGASSTAVMPKLSAKVHALAKEVPSAPQLGRSFPSILPPLGEKATRVQQICEGLWTFAQDFGAPQIGANAGLNMVVARLQSGGLWVWSPVAPTEECLHMLRALGAPVQHIVAPSLSPEHYYYTPALAAHFPDARVWVCPGLLSGGGLPFAGKDAFKQLQETHQVQEYTAADWGSEVEFELFSESTGLFSEAAFHLVDFKAVLLADLAFGSWNDEGMGNALFKSGGKLAGIYKQLGALVAKGVFSSGNREAGQRWAQAVLEWEFDKVMCGHLSPCTPAGVDGKQEFARAFGFLLDQESKSSASAESK